MKKEENVNFPQIDSIEKLKDFLAKKGKRHSPYFHYTTLKTLQGMHQSRKLFLTRADRLNDALECNAAPDIKKRTYIASFSFHKAENIAMWSMYSVPYHQAVRLTIPKRAITKTLKDFLKYPKLYSVNQEKTKEIHYKGCATLNMIDVVYAHPGSLEHDKELLTHSQGDFVIDAKNDPQVAPYVKNEIWLTENETRMVLELSEPLPENVKTIAIDFDYAIKNLRDVFGGPCVSKEFLDLQFPVLAKNGKNHESVAYNKTYFRACSTKLCPSRTQFCINHKNK